MSNAKQQVIAERLSLSRATVSRCFTNHAGISPITRAKVFQVAAEIGYSHMAKRAGSAGAGKARAKSFSALIENLQRFKFLKTCKNWFVPS